jgi:hypothetical protein
MRKLDLARPRRGTDGRENERELLAGGNNVIRFDEEARREFFLAVARTRRLQAPLLLLPPRLSPC